MNKDCLLKGCRHLEVKHQELATYIYPFYYCPKLDKGLTALYAPQKDAKSCECYQGQVEGLQPLHFLKVGSGGQ